MRINQITVYRGRATTANQQSWVIGTDPRQLESELDFVKDHLNAEQLHIIREGAAKGLEQSVYAFFDGQHRFGVLVTDAQEQPIHLWAQDGKQGNLVELIEASKMLQANLNNNIR